MIPDEAVRQMLHEAYRVWAHHDIANEQLVIQNFRGVTSDYWKNNPHPLGCARHHRVFKEFNVIPEYCFGCYKVSIQPRTVVELMKLMIVFDGIELPNDNTRKCMVEARPEVSGSYKGFVYCQSLNEAREILDYFKGVVGEYISNKIPLSIKRGCSEFSLAYPDYDTLGKDDATPMEYKTEWREHETYTDQNLVGDLEPYAYDSYNHQGFELVDVLAMRDWIAYAAAIGDTSYLKLTGKAVEPLKNIDRPQFKPV